MKRLLLTLTVALTLLCSANADIWQTVTIDGTQTSKYVTTITFSGDDVVVTLDEGTTETIQMNTISIALAYADDESTTDTGSSSTDTGSSSTDTGSSSSDSGSTDTGTSDTGTSDTTQDAAIRNIKANATDTNIYNLMGQKVGVSKAALPKGIYITGGQIIIIK